MGTLIQVSHQGEYDFNTPFSNFTSLLQLCTVENNAPPFFWKSDLCHTFSSEIFLFWYYFFNFFACFCCEIFFYLLYVMLLSWVVMITQKNPNPTIKKKPVNWQSSVHMEVIEFRQWLVRFPQLPPASCNHQSKEKILLQNFWHSSPGMGIENSSAIPDCEAKLLQSTADLEEIWLG